MNVGKPIDITVSCYLIHHGNDYFLWDTGISDAVAAMPDGWYPTNNPATDIHWTRAKTLESQLAGIGVLSLTLNSWEFLILIPTISETRSCSLPCRF